MIGLVCFFFLVGGFVDVAQSWRRTELNLLGYLLLVWPFASVCTTGGGYRGGGGRRTPRYHGPLGCLPGRPMGPATLQLRNPLKCFGLLFGSGFGSQVRCRFSVCFFVSGVGIM